MGKFTVVAVGALALGAVGGVAAIQAFQPMAKPAPAQVRLVQPAGQSVPVPAVTTATPRPVVKITPVVRPKAVPLKKAAVKPSTSTVKAATVSDPSPAPTTEPPLVHPQVITDPNSNKSAVAPGTPPPVFRDGGH